MGKTFKQTVPHSAGCFVERGSPWVFTYPVEPDPQRRDSMGRICRRGGYRWWLQVRCNDPLCAGRAIVRLDDFLESLPFGTKDTRNGVPSAQAGMDAAGEVSPASPAKEGGNGE
jgi:hypothetical protein